MMAVNSTKNCNPDGNVSRKLNNYCQARPYQYAIHHGRRQEDVDTADISRKAIQNPSGWVGVEEVHGGPGDAAEQLVV